MAYLIHTVLHWVLHISVLPLILIPSWALAIDPILSPPADALAHHTLAASGGERAKLAKPPEAARV